MAIIEVNHVTKEFRLGALHGMKQTMLNTVARLRGHPVQPRPLFKALDDVDFKVDQGEVLGIIGHNGAGKSTLLKMLANISKPTRGSVQVKGKVAPLIEVGAGLVGDLTGRENVFLNGAILGIPKAEIKKKFDDIVAFAELEEFIDTPIKRYSSGMQVRLGFSIATSVESEILIVDEVLAVGDLAFQRKCFDKMEDLIKRQEKTVLIVSHNIRQIERLCSRTLLLDNGKLADDGPPSVVCNTFIKLMNRNIATSKSQRQVKEVHDSGELRNVEAECIGPDGAGSFVFGQKGILRFRFDAVSEVRNVAVYAGIHTTDFVYLTNNNTAYHAWNFQAGHHVVELQFEEITLIPGTYSALLWIGTPEGKVTYHSENLVTFNVESNDFAISRQLGQALFHIPGTWRIDGIDIVEQSKRKSHAT